MSHTPDKRLLIAFAHPDDESFGLGGLIAKYVAEGVQVDYLCATNGDAGTMDASYLDGYDSIAARRLAELDCATKVLGFSHVVKLGYRDSGMMGTPDNEHPQSLWHTEQTDPDTLTRRVVETLRQLRPQVVITFNRYGGYGHPDHIAIQQATTRAFHLAGDPAYLTRGLTAYQPQKLYYNSIPAFWVRMSIWQARLRGKDPRRMGRNADIDMVKILDYDEPPHVRVDVSAYMAAWDAASACHASQGGGITRGGLLSVMRRLLPVRQGFTRIVPAPVAHRVDEQDLFDGVRVDTPDPAPASLA